jgi:glycosyltransferase involved in cell wall biosynthesis
VRRPTIALACILKNELKNIPRLLASVEGCFDEIHLTDTGSTDGSIAMLEAFQAGENPAKTPLFLHHFPWCDNFAAARNASFEPVKADYVMWLDLDDVLSDKAAFIAWRDEILKIADYWLATYHYALTPEGKPVCSFARERIFRRNLGLKWAYFVHEGVLPTSPVRAVGVQYALTWSVQHLRDSADLAADRSRNLRLFEKNRGAMDARMRYYYGKELFENGKPLEAFSELVNAMADEKLELHDRIMALQYGAFCAMALQQWERAVAMAHQGLQLAPTRAEFYIILADTYSKTGKLVESVPFFEAAANCQHSGDSKMQGAVFQHGDYYRHYPLNSLARVHTVMGSLEKAERYIERAEQLGPSEETAKIKAEVADVRSKLGKPLPDRPRTRDVVISCHPQNMYEWDDEAYRTKGIGGSETACVELAQWIAKKTGRKVLVFNSRASKRVAEGVEYIPVHEVPQYLAHNSPALHVAWRHAVRFSDDPMYLWCHDLAFPGIEAASPTYHKIMALSPFHKRFLHSMYGVPEDRIMLTRNGIDPQRFQGENIPPKVFGKIIFSSSPDRGLERALHVMDHVVKCVPEATLHVYYGFDGMRKRGITAEADRMEAAMRARPYVVNHGNIPQAELTREMQEACLWLYPTDFLETFCITALECLAAHCFPIVRDWGALPDTLARAAEEGSALLLDRDCATPEDVGAWASDVVAALATRPWERMSGDLKAYSWESVADDWIQTFNLAEG